MHTINIDFEKKSTLGERFFKWLKLTHQLSSSNNVQTKGFRHKLGHFLEGKVVQFLILGLIILDLLVVVTELFIEEHYKKCKPDDEIPHAAEIAEHILIYTSLGILFALAFEILLLIVAFGLSFFKHPLYILDAVVIALSITFELEFRDSIGGLLVIFRLWRIVRIIHGVATTIQERDNAKIALLQEQLQSEKDKSMELLRELSALKGTTPKSDDDTSHHQKNYGSVESTPLLG